MEELFEPFYFRQEFKLITFLIVGQKLQCGLVFDVVLEPSTLFDAVDMIELESDRTAVVRLQLCNRFVYRRFCQPSSHFVVGFCQQASRRCEGLRQYTEALGLQMLIGSWKHL